MKRRVRVKRRIISMGLILFCFLVLSLFFFGSRKAGADGSKNPYYKTITVKAGDSLWSLAETYGADSLDIQSYIEKILKLNKISRRDELRCGQKLIIIYYE